MAICSVCGAEVSGAEHCGVPVQEDTEGDFDAPASHSHGPNCC